MEKAFSTFIKYQTEAEERFQRSEEERQKKEMELEEKRRQEDREHEVRMMQMLGHMFQGGSSYHTHTPNTGPGLYEFDDTDDSYYQQ